MRRFWRLARIAVVPLCMATVIAMARPAYARLFGSLTTEFYQNDWWPSAGGRFNIVGGFNSAFNKTGGATQLFYYDLSGAKSDFEESGDYSTGGGLDSVDLAFVITHGSIQGDNQARWTMWDQNVYAYSGSMRLGDDAWQLKVLTDYSCDTQNPSGFGRWWPIMNGGLRIAAGATGHTWNGSSYNNVGKYYANDLIAGWTIKSAWSSATDTSQNNNNISVLGTGTSSDDCYSRLNNMTWENVENYTAYRDSAGWICMYWWDNI